MLRWVVLSIAIWVALAGGVWALLFAHGTRDTRSIDVGVEK